MLKSVSNKLFAYAIIVFFQKFPHKFRVTSLKNLIDFAYIIFEKFAYSFDIIADYYIEFYNEIVEKEIKMAKITSNDLVLVIGCGSIPATSVLISKKTNARTVSIDYDSKAIKKADLFSNKIKLERVMSFKHANGLNYQINNYDVIFILYGVKQQREVLENISKNMNFNARVIYRTTHDIIDEKVGGIDFLSKFFIIIEYFNSDKIILSKSYLLKKKK